MFVAVVIDVEIAPAVADYIAVVGGIVFVGVVAAVIIMIVNVEFVVVAISKF